MERANYFDVVIVGGSYAGLSAAMALGRSLRNVLVIDSGLPCNRQTPHSHNFITQDGETPLAISKKAREQVMRYPTVHFLDGVALSGVKTVEGFAITTKSGDTSMGRKLILATGIEDQLPDIKGFDQCWGISVVHCPYCHGYEFRDQRTGILANGDRAFHLASLVNNLTDKLAILTSGPPTFSAHQLASLKRHGIEMIDGSVVEIVHRDGHLENVVFDDGTRTLFHALYAAVPFIQRSEIPVALGCDLTEHGHIKVDSLQRTTVEGVYACGDNSSPMRSVANAVAAGNFTGAMVNSVLTEEAF
ncbi:NAD(P)/FAD-dependent oxidoreductase [Parapedobacter sp. 10938]|uniref:NAD(P)/FAD-dependent oxidoreductase n=1 Tax=Parapedobacter flavus TaxID=3110225 RepID=UPI002DBA30B8|nr:NAD(P)/FAD-dependent oxidoreductase [Parapedobacter sp. 10938]MEC3880391.1 NAD(P)/FAD-dependent oxidoreductase [Parapedobacter sp. 10938]